MHGVSRHLRGHPPINISKLHLQHSPLGWAPQLLEHAKNSRSRHGLERLGLCPARGQPFVLTATEDPKRGTGRTGIPKVPS